MSIPPEHLRTPSPLPGEGLLGELTSNVIRQQLREFRALNDVALLNTLSPHEQLPNFDAAGFIIEYQKKAGTDPEQLAAYNLGVVFGRSLMLGALRGTGKDVPPVNVFDDDQERSITEYLGLSRQLPLRTLTHDSKLMHPTLYEAVSFIEERCRVIVPDLMFGRADELVRGYHDYLSVLSLLEAQPRHRMGTMIRWLGGRGLGLVARRRLRHHRNPDSRYELRTS